MDARLGPAPHESLYDAIGRWAAAAPVHLLRVLLWSGMLGAVAVLTIDSAQWYVGTGLVAVAALGAWGLLEHWIPGRAYQRRIEAAELALATVMAVAALVSILVGLFVFLGPAPHF